MPLDTLPPAPALTQRRPYREVWTMAALQVIHRLTGETAWCVEERSAAPPAPGPVDLAAHWDLSGALSGKLQARLPRAAARAWAGLLHPAERSEASAALTAAENEALAEVLGQIAAAGAAGLAAGGWGEVTLHLCHLGPLRRTVETGDGEFALRFRHPDQDPLELDLAFDTELREQFRRGPGALAERDEPGAGGPFDLLLDVEIGVTLRFGGRQMPLSDVLALAPGSVLELDRQIDDPVELLVSGKTVAWGEVVVVDGNYGLRVTRLVRHRDRLAAVGANL